MRLSINEIIKKGIDMFSIADNPPFFGYRLNHYLKKPVALKKAKEWSEKNKKYYEDKGIDVIWFETYDGSNQICHPDITFWHDNYWMVATPYPYGMEEYENPSIYFGKQLTDMNPLQSNPIAYPSKKGYGSHLSDPCLFSDDEYLYCFYRDTINNGNEIENRICYKKYDGNSFTQEKILLSSFDDGLLSPAVLCIENVKYLFYVSYIQGELSLVMANMSDDMVIDDSSKKLIFSKDSEWNIWHFDAKSTKDGIAFLLLQRSKKDKKKFKLQKGTFDLTSQSIVLGGDILIPDDIKDVMAFPYKSCMITDSKKILLSFRDINNVYVTKAIEMREENE